MAVTDTGGVLTGTAEWAIYAALKQGGTLLFTADLANEIWTSMSDADCSKMVSADLSVWINDSTGLVLIGLDGDLSIPATATAEGVICVAAMSSVTLAVGFELLGISGPGPGPYSYSSALIALNDTLEDWTNNLISALEH